MKTDQAKTLSPGFLRSVEAFGNRLAVEVSGKAVTYTDLFEQAASLAATLAQHQVGSEPPMTAVFASIIPVGNSLCWRSGGLAARLRLCAATATFPPEHTRTMLQRSPNNTQLESTHKGLPKLDDNLRLPART